MADYDDCDHSSTPRDPVWIEGRWGNSKFWEQLAAGTLPHVCTADLRHFIDPGRDVGGLVRLTKADFNKTATELLDNLSGAYRWDWFGAWALEDCDDFANVALDKDYNRDDYVLIISFDKDEDAFLFKLTWG